MKHFFRKYGKKIFILLPSVIWALSVFAQTSEQDTIPNADFEYWSGGYPENWETNSCPPCVPPYETYIAQKDSINVYHGNFSIKLLYNNTHGFGYDPPWIKTKFPVLNHPASLEVAVKCELFGNDTVSIGVKVFVNNNVVDSGYWQSTTSINQFQQISIPITTSSTIADSILIHIIGGKAIRDSTLSNDTKFWVDNLSFSYAIGNNDDKKNNNNAIRVYPVPAKKNITVEYKENENRLSSIKLYDLFGNEVNMSENILFNKQQMNIDISHLSDGIYFLHINTTKNNKISKIIKISEL